MVRIFPPYVFVSDLAKASGKDPPPEGFSLLTPKTDPLRLPAFPPSGLSPQRLLGGAAVEQRGDLRLRPHQPPAHGLHQLQALSGLDGGWGWGQEVGRFGGGGGGGVSWGSWGSWMGVAAGVRGGSWLAGWGGWGSWRRS